MKNINLILLAAIVALTCSGGYAQAGGKSSTEKKPCAQQYNKSRHDDDSSPRYLGAHSVNTPSSDTSTPAYAKARK